MGETQSVLTAPVTVPGGRRFRPRARGLVLIGIVAVLTSQTTLWSASAGHGGTDAAGNWIDGAGNPVTAAPPTVDVVGHPAPAALAVLLLVVVVGIVAPPTLARYGRPGLGELVRWGAYAAVVVCAVVGTLVYTVWQGHVVMDQINRQVLEPHGFPWGGVTVTTGHETR
ncbi:hypothetical protein [Curtobacterium sp. MCBD17_021]|uniref:hypothetical protein n=1 Tax=Curtobacterium sp. MCBD17_021 TaxID=2175665 RepID=UPI000DA718E4|nr:hypothetical protein [Curtobacterium sp. MCBD17_021]PZE69590.1 hypothetical protein DEI83_00620 [Curtobacterium sp. MCBD17_021]